MLKFRGWKQRKNWRLRCPVCEEVFDMRDFIDEYGELPPFVPAIAIFYGRPLWDVKARLYFCSQKCRNKWKDRKGFEWIEVKDLVEELRNRRI